MIMDGAMADEGAERRLDELRERVNMAVKRDRSVTAKRMLGLLRRMCYVVAAIVFVVTLFVLDFIYHPK
jgi:hypothetical protein